VQPAGDLVAGRLRSRCRLAQIFSTAAWSSGRTGRQDGERSAATAAERASFGSFLFTAPAASSRTRAASLGCTSSTRSPAATSSWASRCPSPPAPSTAQVRSGHACARPAAAAPARPGPGPGPGLAEPHPRPAPPPCAIPYAGPRRSSPPPRPAPFLTFTPDGNRGGHALLQIGHRRTSYEPRHGEVRQAGTSFESQAADRPAADMRASPAGPLNATTSAVTPAPILQ
jgi:translation initiation factor IF-2